MLTEAKSFTTIAEDLPEATRAFYSLEPGWGEKLTGIPKTRKPSLKADKHAKEASTKRNSRFISHLGGNAESGWADLFPQGFALIPHSPLDHTAYEGTG